MFAFGPAISFQQVDGFGMSAALIEGVDFEPQQFVALVGYQSALILDAFGSHVGVDDGVGQCLVNQYQCLVRLSRFHQADNLGKVGGAAAEHDSRFRFRRCSLGRRRCHRLGFIVLRLIGSSCFDRSF